MAEELDLEGVEDGFMSGTFRWKKTKKLPSMKKMTKMKGEEEEVDLSNGWMGYFLSRCSSGVEASQLVSQARSDLSLIDCLSTPLSIAYLCRQAGLYPSSSSSSQTLEEMHIVCIGSSSKAEGRVLNETNCFAELPYLLTKVKSIFLYLVGPEMSSTTLASPRQLAENLFTSEFQGTCKDFFRQMPQLLMGNSTVVVGVNCGFGNWENPMPVRFKLLMEWIPDLYFITGTKLPLLFTCANDYADLAGEVAVMKAVMGCYFIVGPSRNQFSYASTLIPPGRPAKEAKDDYSCGNSFFYGVQGHDKTRRRIIDGNNVKALMAVLLSQSEHNIESISRKSLPFGTRATNSRNSDTSKTCADSLQTQKVSAEKLKAEREAIYKASLEAEAKAAKKLEDAREEIKSIVKLGDTSTVGNRTCSEQATDGKVCMNLTTNNNPGPAPETPQPHLSKLSHHLFVAHQEKRDCGKLIHLTVSFSVKIVSMSQLSLDYQQRTQSLRLNVSSNQINEDVFIPLLSPIATSSIKAKFRKSKGELIVMANVV